MRAPGAPALGRFVHRRRRTVRARKRRVAPASTRGLARVPKQRACALSVLVVRLVALGKSPSRSAWTPLLQPGPLPAVIEVSNRSPATTMKAWPELAVDGDPPALAAAAPAHEAARGHRGGEEVTAVEGVAHRAGAVVAAVVPAGRGRRPTCRACCGCWLAALITLTTRRARRRARSPCRGPASRGPSGRWAPRRRCRRSAPGRGPPRAAARAADGRSEPRPIAGVSCWPG